MSKYDCLKSRLSATCTGPQNGTRADALRAIIDLENEIDWRPIETAPKDGSVVMLFRQPAAIGVSSQVVFGAWVQDEWAWPSDIYNPYDDALEDEKYIDGYGSNEFTHWMPLPEAPPPYQGDER